MPVGYPLAKAYEGVGKVQHEVEAVLGSEAHVGVPLPLGQGLYLVYVERPVVKQDKIEVSTTLQGLRFVSWPVVARERWDEQESGCRSNL